MSQEVDEVYALISKARYWKDFIPSKLEPLSDEELLLLSEKFYLAIEEVNKDLGLANDLPHEALLLELRKLEQRVSAVNEYYISREDEEEDNDLRRSP